MTEPNLALSHPQYPDGFPARVDDSLLGQWRTPRGVVVVTDHPHGYEVHLYPCLNCDACADGDHRRCDNHGPILTVAGGVAGYDAVLRYLAMEESDVHVRELGEREEKAQEAERLFREQERLENEAQMEAERAAITPSVAERLAALEAEIAALRQAEG